jgi:ribosomal-protein-alanine N-acetyltransferase
MLFDQLSLKRLTINDLPQIIELENSTDQEPWSVSNFEGEFSRSFSLSFGLFQDLKLLAFCFAWNLPPESHLLKLAVHPQYQGKGLALNLMKILISFSHKTGSAIILLEVRFNNNRAIRLYRGLGFNISGRRIKYYTNGEDAFLMDLNIKDFLNNNFRPTPFNI